MTWIISGMIGLGHSLGGVDADSNSVISKDRVDSVKKGSIVSNLEILVVDFGEIPSPTGNE